jgi:hypothetical protein
MNVINHSELNTSDDILESFLNTFQLLSRKQQKIWQLLQWYSIHYHQVFPSHETIAKRVGCHRDTVIQAIKKFSELGWIKKWKRCYRSCLYYVEEILRKIDTKRNDTFRRNPTENPTENPTLYTTYSSSCNVRYEKPPEKRAVTVQSIKDQKEEILKNIGINDKKDFWCLKRYPERILILALEDLKTRFSKEPIRKLAAWITNRCKEHLKKYGG